MKTNKTLIKRLKLTPRGKLLRRHQLAVGHLKRKKSKGSLERAKKQVEIFGAIAKKYKKLIGA